MRCLTTMGGVWVASSEDGCFGACKPCNAIGGEIAWNNQCVLKNTIPLDELRSCKYVWKGCFSSGGVSCPQGAFEAKSMCVPQEYRQCVN